jgi:hypothetical protein
MATRLPERRIDAGLPQIGRFEQVRVRLPLQAILFEATRR